MMKQAKKVALWEQTTSSIQRSDASAYKLELPAIPHNPQRAYKSQVVENLFK